VCAAAALLAAAPAWPQSLTTDRLGKFLTESAALNRTNPSNDWEDLLYAVVRTNLSPEAAAAEFARRVGVSSAAARDYASLIVESVISDEACVGERYRSDPCVFLPGKPRYERAASLGLAEPTGNLLIVVARSPLFTRWDEAAFIRLAGRHPAAATIFGALFDRSRHSGYLLAMLAAGPLTDRAGVVAATTRMWDLHWSHGDDGLRQALLESVARSATSSRASAAARAGLAQTTLLWELELGLNEEAVARYYAYPADVRRLLPLPMSLCMATIKECSEAEEMGYRLADELAAALWLTGHKQDARRLLLERVADFGARRAVSAQRYLALSEAIAPAHRREDLFPLFITGRLPGQPKPPSDLLLLPSEGWLFRVRTSSDALRRVVANRLRAAGYADMAAFLAFAHRDFARFEDPVLAAAASMFAEPVRARRAYWLPRIEAAATRVGSRGPAVSVRVPSRALPAWWTERPLPESLAAWGDTDTPSRAPAGTDLPVDARAILRYEDRDGERAIVYRSFDYDLRSGMGDTPGFGIWYVRTVRGTWAAPIYLGLQQHFPYVVTAGSRLPMLDGTRLRLEVQVREVDPGKVVLGSRPSVGGRYLDFDLATLTLDRDKDGLTDIEEHRLGLDFANDDTDGDGVADGRDPLPLTAYRAAGRAVARALAEAMPQTFGRDWRSLANTRGSAPAIQDFIAVEHAVDARDRIRARLIVGDPAMFAGVATPFRLVVYAPRDLEALNRGAAPFEPARIDVFSSLDRTTHFVGWSQPLSGGGGAIVTCSTADGPCSVRTVSSWIE
jgi:hypothetical protein